MTPPPNPILNAILPPATSPGKTTSVSEAAMDYLLTAVWRYHLFNQEDSPASAAVLKSTDANSRETALLRLERLGMRLGFVQMEKLNLDRTRFADTLESVKFLCKDFWQSIFHKQMDNLKTNHRGVFVLQDNEFRWLARYQVPTQQASLLASTANPSTAPQHSHMNVASENSTTNSPDTQLQLLQHGILAMSGGIMHGALLALGYQESKVQADLVVNAVSSPTPAGSAQAPVVSTLGVVFKIEIGAVGFIPSAGVQR